MNGVFLVFFKICKRNFRDFCDFCVNLIICGHSLLDEVTHLVVVAVNAKECGGEEQELRAEQQHGVVNLSLRRKEEGGSPEKDCRAPG